LQLKHAKEHSVVKAHSSKRLHELLNAESAQQQTLTVRTSLSVPLMKKG